MDSLPAELLSLVLLWNIRMSRCEKNTILPLRLVCKAFDEILKPYVFKTIQLEFSRFLRQRRGPVEVKNWDEEGKIVRELQGHGSGLDGVWGNEAIWKLRMDREGLRRVGGCCEALYLDLMVVRDEGMFFGFLSIAWKRYSYGLPATQWHLLTYLDYRGNNPPFECFPGTDTQGSRDGPVTRFPTEILHE
jgi:hypothetical protein